MEVLGPRKSFLTGGWCRPFESARPGVPRIGFRGVGGLGPGGGTAAQPQAVRNGGVGDRWKGQTGAGWSGLRRKVVLGRAGKGGLAEAKGGGGAKAGGWSAGGWGSVGRG